MKNIEIKGRYNCYKINKANDCSNNDTILKRECMNSLPNYIFDYKYQIEIINKILLDFENIKFNNSIQYKKELLREIEKKILSYKNQDIIKNKFNNNNIKLEETIEKIVISKLICYYCKCKLKLFYQKVRDMEQWTLDRIDNNLPHENKNVIVCCLKCNLQRRKQDKDNFLFTKQLKIEKKNN